MFALGAFISLPFAAAAKALESAIAFFLYRKPMSRLIGGSHHALRRVYLESLMLALAAILPALLLMLWSGWSPLTPLLLVAAAIALGALLWLILLFGRRHPIILEAARVLGRPL